jgi:hypothetical protein
MDTPKQVSANVESPKSATDPADALANLKGRVRVL